MEKTSVTHSTFVIEHNYPTSPERIFAALPIRPRNGAGLRIAKKGGAEVFEIDFRVGGNERTTRRLSVATPFPAVALTNYTTYQYIVPNCRVVIAYTMTLGENRISASLDTFELVPMEKGINLVFTEQSSLL